MRSVLHLALTLMFAVTPYQAIATTVEIGSGLRVHVPLKSWRALRDENLVIQRFDYSCGSAALATLMRYAHGRTVGEKAILDTVFQTLPRQDRRARKEKGLSLLDLQRAAEHYGFHAQGFKLRADQLPKLKGPVIVFISPGGYDHFAVLRGVRGGRVYLADPSSGNVRMPAYRFLESWLGSDGKGIIFAIQRKDPRSDQPTKLKPLGDGLAQPEILAARQMLAVGNLLTRMPALRR